jgi:hypothetical protein
MKKFRPLVVVSVAHRDLVAFVKKHGIEGEEYFSVNAHGSFNYMQGLGNYDFVFVDGVSWSDLSDDVTKHLKDNGTQVVLQMSLSRRVNLARRTAWKWIKESLTIGRESRRVPLVAWYDE